MGIIMNKLFVTITLIIILTLLTSITTYKVITKHNEKLLLVENKYIIEQAKKCFSEKKCNEDNITLKKLYSLNYLEKQVNPVTKEYYNELSYVKKDTEWTFVEVN